MSHDHDATAFRAATAELQRLLGALFEPELTTEVAELISHEFVQFVEVEVYPSAAGLAGPCRMRMKPGELFLRLISAARTGDPDVVRSATHEIRSLLGLAATG